MHTVNIQIMSSKLYSHWRKLKRLRTESKASFCLTAHSHGPKLNQNNQRVIATRYLLGSSTYSDAKHQCECALWIIFVWIELWHQHTLTIVSHIVPRSRLYTVLNACSAYLGWAVACEWDHHTPGGTNPPGHRFHWLRPGREGSTSTSLHQLDNTKRILMSKIPFWITLVLLNHYIFGRGHEDTHLAVRREKTGAQKVKDMYVV